MPRKKLQRFAELDTFSNVAQLSQSNTKKKLKDFLKNNKPVVLELGCGKGEYTIALAQEGDNNYIGVDIQGERLWFGAKQALGLKLDNVLFLRAQIENILEYFDKKSIDSIWLTFPDPLSKKRQAKKRLTSPIFLSIYQKLLKPKGVVHLKTDNKQLYEYSKETIKTFGAKINTKIKDTSNVQSFYEQKYLADNKKIYYLQFIL